MNDLTLAALRRLRWAVRATLTLGVVASIAANVLHAQPNIISQIISAWPPLALLLTVELTSRIPMHRPLLAVVRVFSTAVIAGIAAWVSYWHMQDVAVRFGETSISAYLLPVSVDGLIVVASVSLVELAGRIRSVEQPVPADPAPAGPAPGPVAAATSALTAAMVGSARANGHEPDDTGPGQVETARVPDPAPSAHDSAAPVGKGRSRNPAKRTRSAFKATPPARRPAAGAGRGDAELLAQLRALPVDEAGAISVRGAAKALGTGPDRARRLLTEAGLRQPTTGEASDGQ